METTLQNLGNRLKQLGDSCPSEIAQWVSQEKWQRLNQRERAFLILWRGGVKDTKIQEVLFFNSISGVRMMRKRVLGKIK